MASAVLRPLVRCRFSRQRMTEDALARAAAAGIHRITVPTPFAVGRVNVYLIEDDPLTLVDAGPNSGTSFDVLQRGIEALGHSLEDIGLVILTHQHIDHLGLVGLVASRSGAEVAALDAAVPFVERFSEEAEADDAFARDVMLRHGIPEDVVSALSSVSRAFRAWGARADVTRVLHDGETIELRDRDAQVFHRPGHSPTDTIFHDADAQAADRRRPPARPHLLQPADHPPARRQRGPPAGADDLPRLAAARPREMDVDAGAARPRRADHRPPRR